MSDVQIIINNKNNHWETKEEEIEKARRFYDRYSRYKNDKEVLPAETTYLSQGIFEED